ncbi:hypothetical protein ACQ4PT_055075 [Festuca glaucescens]
MAPSSSSNWAMAPPYHYHGPPPQKEQAAPAAEDETGAGSVGFQPRSLWIGGLLNWMDENYLYSCFTRSPELVSVVIKRNKETRQSEGFGFLNFADHATADQILQSYNGQKMPNSDRDFKLNWVIRAAPEKPAKPAEDDHAIYAGDWPLMASAEEALRILDGSQLGDNTMRISGLAVFLTRSEDGSAGNFTVTKCGGILAR